MDNRHLWLRSKRQHAILRVRHTIIKAVRDFFDDRGFTLVDAPIFTPNACEGTSTLFETDYHGDKAYLTQSGQLYMEAAARGVRQASTASAPRSAPRRARRAGTSPSSGWSSPRSPSWTSTATCDLAEDFLVVRRRPRARDAPRGAEGPRARHRPSSRRCRRPSRASPTPRRSSILQKNGHPEAKVGDDFGGDEETVICERSSTARSSSTATRSTMKAFYFKHDPSDPSARARHGRARARGLRRDHRRRAARGRPRQARGGASSSHKLPREAFEWYLDLRRYGTFPHAGFGLGIERTVAWICGLPHVRETIPFPRMLNRLAP